MAKQQPNNLKGLKEVMNNLNKEVEKIKGRSMRGLIRATIPIRQSMNQTPPKVPWDTGNLNASWFVVTGTKTEKGSSPNFQGDDAEKRQSDHRNATSEAKAKAAGKPIVIMGLSANYAGIVHEIPRKYKRPGSGADFLRSAISENHGVVIQIIKEDASV